MTQARGNPGGKEITMDEVKLKPCPFCGFINPELHAYIEWCKTDEGHKYLKGGEKYVEESECEGQET